MENQKELKKCIHCGLLITESGRSRYCSDTCSRKYHWKNELENKINGKKGFEKLRITFLFYWERKLRNPISVLIFFALLSLCYYVIYEYIYLFYDSLFKGEGIKVGNIIGFLLFIFILYIIISLLRTGLIKLNPNFTKLNWYIISSILLVITILIFGFNQLISTYPTEVPFSMKLNPTTESNVTSSLMYCSSEKGYTSFVMNDILNCNIIFNLPSNITYEYAEITKANYRLGIKNTTHDNKRILFSKEGKETYQLIIPLDQNKDFDTLNIDFYLMTIGDNIKTTYMFFNTRRYYNLLSHEEYIKRSYEKITLLIMLITLSIYTIFVGINNLKQMVEGNK